MFTFTVSYSLPTHTHTEHNILYNGSTVWASTPQCVPAAIVHRHVIMESVSNSEQCSETTNEAIKMQVAVDSPQGNPE